MGVREALNENRKVKIVILSCLGLFVAFWLFRTAVPSAPPKLKAFYTVDDGATWFADDADKVPPFDHNGKQAVTCFVYQAGDGKPFVSHLQRYSAEGLKQRSQQQSGEFNPMGFDASRKGPFEVKEALTGEKAWVSINSPRAAAIQELKMPTGASGDLMPLDPNK